ncbi:MAG: putative RNA methyltransferase [Jatrophihabitantaceae bacterium]
MTGGGLGLVVDRLACPICRCALTMSQSALICTAGHSFDIARQGYVSLFDGGPRANTGDGAAMVAARARFLGVGHYLPIADAITDATAADAVGLCLDLAGGTGYYLAHLLDHRPGLVGLTVDLSAPASRRASRAHDRLAAVAADAWQQLPVRDGAATSVLSVFGPRNPTEIRRVLAPTGRLILVTPTGRHLAEPVQRLDLLTVDPRKRDRIAVQFAQWPTASERAVEWVVELDRAALLDAVLMGPNAHHVDRAVLTARVDALPEPFRVTVSVVVSELRPPR